VAALFVGAGGASSFFVTRETADCQAALAGSEARAQLVAEALDACRVALDALASPGAVPGPSVLGGCVAVAGEPVSCPDGCVPAFTPDQQAAIDAARAAVQAATPPR
jgi:hypothetical protein